MTKRVRCMRLGELRVLCVLCVSWLVAQPAQGQEVQVEASKDTGSIAGVVRFDGDVPKPQALKVTVPDKACHSGPMYSEKLVVSKDKKIQWAVASIKKPEGGKSFPEGNTNNPVTLDQKGCRFIPHVVICPKGRPLQILNSDGILHNVHTMARKNQPFNKGMPGRVKKLDVTFKRAERFAVKCDVHAWMGAWIIVTDHPYYAVSGSDGTFTLDQVPPGKHKVQIWHETLGTQEKEVTVKAGEETKVEFVLKK